MRASGNPDSERCERLRHLPKWLRWGLLALAVVVLGLAYWPRARPASQPVGPDTSVARPDRKQSRAVRTSAGGSAETENAPASTAPSDKLRIKALREAFLAIQTLVDPMEQDAALARFKETLAPEMVAAVLDGLSVEALRSDAARALFDYWATANPAAAAEWARGETDQQARRTFLEVAALRWAGTDLKGAAAWARNFPPGQARTRVMEAVGSEAVRADPLEALLIGLELAAGGSEQNSLISRAAAEWAVMDRKEAVEWVGTLEDADLRQRLTEQVAVASADQDPLAAATLAVERMAPGVEQDRAVVSIVAQWVQTDPENAAAWVRKFPEGPLGRDAMDNLINLWAGRDLVASGKWLATLPRGQMQEVGLQAYARVLARTEADLARGLAPASASGP